MKFMKLGSRPDTFYTSEAVRSVSSEVSSDLIVHVNGSRYLLHKFPLLSKCLRLQRLCSESPESSHQPTVHLPDFPGGDDAFELCAKFCYGITITLSAHNFVAARCAADYLQMTEDAEKGNLIYKLEVFFNSCLLHGWRDSILTLTTTKTFPFLSEDLGITSRCIDSIAGKILSNPAKVSLSYSYSRRGRDDLSSCNGAETQSQKHRATVRGGGGASAGWWGEDLAELGIDLYWRTMVAVKSGGNKLPANLLGDALRIYAARWLPSSTANLGPDSKHRMLLESIISLLPLEKGSVSCGFLLKLLKAANLLRASAASKIELARRVGIQLEEANVRDLLIPLVNDSGDNKTIYDVDIVMKILEEFKLQGQSPPTSPVRVKGGFERRRRSRSAENVDFEFQESRRSSSASHSSKLKVAKLVDGYLQEIARDQNLPLSKFIALAEAVPGFARLDHDDLYRAIDIYLKEHPDLNKSERKRICRTLDCKKLSMETCMHAAQNELLPLRVVVQVLFFEQARTAMAGGQVTDLPPNIKALLTSNGHQTHPKTAPQDDQWSVSGLKSPKSKLSTLRMKLAEDEDLEEIYDPENGIGKSSRVKSVPSTNNRSRKMFGKLWSVNRSASEKN